MKFTRLRNESGQALVLVLGMVAVLLAGMLVLAAFGQALGGRSAAQRAADLSAMSAARSMQRDYPRLFLPPVLPNGAPNPRHMPLPVYLARARGAAATGARRNGARVRPRRRHVPRRVVRAHAGRGADPRLGEGERGRGGLAAPAHRAGEGARRGRADARPRAMRSQGRRAAAAAATTARWPTGWASAMRPDVAAAFDRMAAAARRDGHSLSITSAFRSDAEQARLFAANPNPRWVAPPGTSLHRYATELDLGPPGAYGWLKANARRFGFIHRYAWEPWHYGFGANPRDRQHPAQYERGSWEPPGGDHGRIHHGLPSFVPPRFHDPIARAALRWNVPMSLLAAQLYAESNFNPFATSGAGAQGIAQFMPGTARAYGLRDAFDPEAAIDAQAHLMSDLLREFGGKVGLALAAYNAGPGAVRRYGGIPPFAETRAYVAKILGLLGGAGELAAPSFQIGLVE